MVGLALQVQSDHYEEFFAPELEKHGYMGVYKKKTGEVRHFAQSAATASWCCRVD
jgi:mRNA deadenylase 3'-5' endonuclease subunit Ccr4